MLNAFRNSRINNIRLNYKTVPTTTSDRMAGIKITNSWSCFIENIFTELGTDVRNTPEQSSVGIWYSDNCSGITTNNCIIQDVKDAFLLEATNGTYIGFRFTNCTHEGGTPYTSGASRTFVLTPPSEGLQGLYISNFKCEIVDKFIDCVNTNGGTIFGLYVNNSFFKGEFNTETYNIKQTAGFSLFDTNHLTQYSNSKPAIFDTLCHPSSITSAIFSRTIKTIEFLETNYGDSDNTNLNGGANQWNNVVIPNTSISIGQFSTCTPSVVDIFIRYFRDSDSTTLKFRLSSNTGIEADASGNYGQGAIHLVVPIHSITGDVGKLQYFSSSTGCKMYQLDARYTN